MWYSHFLSHVLLSHVLPCYPWLLQGLKHSKALQEACCLGNQSSIYSNTRSRLRLSGQILLHSIQACHLGHEIHTEPMLSTRVGTPAWALSGESQIKTNSLPWCWWVSLRGIFSICLTFFFETRMKSVTSEGDCWELGSLEYASCDLVGKGKISKQFQEWALAEENCSPCYILCPWWAS